MSSEGCQQGEGCRQANANVGESVFPGPDAQLRERQNRLKQNDEILRLQVNAL
jgi:hypothetical protein